MRQLAHDKEGKDLIVAFQHWFRRAGLVVRVQHHPNQQKQRKLKQHHEPAQDDRLLAVALVAAGEGAVRSSVDMVDNMNKLIVFRCWSCARLVWQ